MESLRLLRQAIHTVVRNGTFARFIPSGMNVINGGKASSFISFPDSSLSLRVDAAKRVNKKAGL